MEPSSGIGHIATSLSASINKKVDNAKNAISNFTFTSKGSTKKQITQTEMKEDSPSINKIISQKEETKSIAKIFDFNSEISKLNNAVDKATNNLEIKESLKIFGINIVSNCITGKSDKDTLIASERYVNVILDVANNKPEAANMCMQYLANRLYNINVACALLNNPRFKVSSLETEQAKVILDKGMDIVEEFREVTPSMLNNICELIKFSKVNRQMIEVMIEKSLIVSNLDLAESLVEINGGNIPNKESIMDRSLQERNIDLAMFVVEHEGEATIQKLIKKCIDGNLEFFLDDILTVTDQKLPSEQVSQFSIQAHSQGNLSLMKVLIPEGWKELASGEFKIISEESKPDKLTQYFLNSNIREVDEFTSFLNEKGLITNDQLYESTKFNESAGRLIARFPSPSDQKEMHKTYGQKYNNYEQQQKGYGVSRLKVVNQTIGEIKENPSKFLESIYLELNSEKPWRTGITTTVLLSRYAMFKKLAINKIKQSNNDLTPNVTKDVSKNSVNISINLSEGETFKLTTLAPAMGYGEPSLSFRHSAPIFKKTDTGQVSEDPHWLDQLGISKDWDTLVNMKVDIQNPESIKEFKNKVAEFYWKGIQLMPTERGNSQNMLELHYIQYKLHDLIPPAASRNAILPDCVALCSTLAEFMKLYNSCWDNS